MPEQFEQNVLEQEIAELSQKIEEKRTQLEKESNILDEKDLVRAAVEDTVNDQRVLQQVTIQKKDDDTSYLDTLSEENANKVSSLLGILSEKGLKHAIDMAKSEAPVVLDAFHDSLVDRMYEELRARKLIS
tara:strand:- start:381 stop:773 length:393 start_codon:yes stop_codon:yes gene_type:complete